MHTIKPIHQATRAEIRDMAHAAAQNGEPLPEANPFEPGTAQHLQFSTDFRERQAELQAAPPMAPVMGRLSRYLRELCHGD